MPEVGRETELRELNFVRFIRVGKIIYYSEDAFAIHSAIAEEFGVTETIEEGGILYYLVDDAGLMKIGRGDKKLWFDESTTSTRVRGDKEKARKETIATGKEIFGKERVSDTFYLF